MNNLVKRERDREKKRDQNNNKRLKKIKEVNDKAVELREFERKLEREDKRMLEELRGLNIATASKGGPDLSVAELNKKLEKQAQFDALNLKYKNNRELRKMLEQTKKRNSLLKRKKKGHDGDNRWE